MSYGVFRRPPHLRRPAPPRQRLPVGAFTEPNTWVRVSFPTPQNAPSGDEEFAVEVRRTGAGGVDPQVRIELWEDGVFRATALANTAVTSTTSQIVRGVWNASSLTTTDGSAVECYVYGTSSSTGARVEIGAIEWNATPTGGAPQTENLSLLSASASLQNTTVTPGAVSTTLSLQSAATSLLTATVTPGAVSTTLSLQSAASSLLTATDSTTTPGVTQNLGLLSATGALLTPTIAQTTYLGALSATAAMPTATVTPGAVSQTLALQTATLAQLTATVTPGPRSTTLALQSASGSLLTATGTPGAVSTPLSLQTAAGALRTATDSTTSPGVTVNLGVLALTAAQPAVQTRITLVLTVAASDDAYVGGGGGAVWPPTEGSWGDNTDTDIETARSFISTYHISQGLFRWDTSAIPDDATVTDAQLRLYVISIAGSTRTFTAEYYPAWNGTFSYSHWTSTVGTDAHAGTTLSTITASTTRDFALDNLTSINRSGYTALRTHISGTTAPTGGNQLTVAAFEHATHPAPRLVVTYVPSTGVEVNLPTLSATAAMPTPTVTPGPTSTTLALQSAAGALRTTTVTPGPVTLQLLVKPLEAGDTTYTIEQLKHRTLEELATDDTTLEAALLDASVTSGAIAQLGVLAATGALRNTTVTPGPTSTPLALQTLAAALRNITVSSQTTVALGLLSAAGALRNTTVTIGGVTTPLETLALALVLRDLDTGLGITPTVILALQSVPEATLVLETVASATVGAESVPSATVGVETGPTAQIDDEDVPTATVALAP